MEALNVLTAALGAFILGSVWYMMLAETWKRAAGVSSEQLAQYEGGIALRTFGISFVLQLVVAGMMRHVFALSGIDAIGEGFVAGLGIGLFFISPWIAINNLYSMRPARLSLIDAGYATLACAVMGLILTLF
ncbi:DUF1761 domain-containing protein [Ruegeria sediminis]|uniref:DUF1761 domain-containing protein n=1 Tax=Ruegeria sediminis TaxID=2583820 RepID=A0ABY2WWU5_9RHOB|nr:DUF1761 domain-containing protein [Ruegeria sediminis]TMV07229.1 DUF1761 domain-containing protein [Ruegeria sediminis]